MEVLSGRSLMPGAARGTVLVAREPLSFWGGLNPASGEVIDRRHDLSGQRITDRVLVVPYSRGSSSTSSTLMEAIRARTAPAAIITRSPDPVITLGCIVAAEIYGRTVPVVSLDPSDYSRLETGDHATLAEDGRVMLEKAKRPPASVDPEIEIHVSLFGWRGELLPGGGTVGSRGQMRAPAGCGLHGFLTRLAEQNPAVRQRYFEPNTLQVRGDVIVLLNETYANRSADTPLSPGDRVCLLPVFDGG